ncbi:Annexin-B9 [Drechslerella dactyloides]|uniref:Annexin-B9 n=1 Tax=Drechslerella dactyloides TaxID=74499 RepID=A0AAD6NIV4_DREDA|nr:Annexin-B9 [Drechslerella dactyloides]
MDAPKSSSSSSLGLPTRTTRRPPSATSSLPPIDLDIAVDDSAVGPADSGITRIPLRISPYSSPSVGMAYQQPYGAPPPPAGYNNYQQPGGFQQYPPAGPSQPPPPQGFQQPGGYYPPPGPQQPGYPQYPPGPGAYPPPPGQYGQQPPPQQPYGAPLPHPGAANPQYLPQQPPGAYPQQYPIPAAPSPGFEDPLQFNAHDQRLTRDADALRSAMKGFGTNQAELIRVMSALNSSYAIHSVARAFQQRYNRDLLTDLKKETSGNFQDTLLALARGPLLEEVHAVHAAIHRPGTTETVLDDVLLCRSPPDLDAIKKAYKHTFSRDLEADVRGDLSMKTENMFAFALQNRRAPDNAPVDMGQIEKDVYNIHLAMEGVGGAGVGGILGGTHQESVYSTILSRNDAQLGAIAHSYERMYHRRLDNMIEKKFSGHMQQSLLYAVRGGTDKALRDAMLLEDAMAGMGTRDSLLIHRLVKFHWNKPHFENVKRAYHDTYQRSLEDAVRKETSGDYRKLLVAIVQNMGNPLA